MCDTPGCGRPIPIGGEGHPEICPTCLEADAPAGWDWKRHVREANKKLAERGARIAALEAEVAARLVERDGWMEAAAMSGLELAEAKAAMKRERVYVVEAEVSAAVQAERDRGLYWWLRHDLTPTERTERIKNGDPKP